MRPFNFFLLGTLYNMSMLSDMDAECNTALTRLRDVLTLNTLPTNPQDIQLMLYSGKQPFDLGSKSLCELNPEMQYMTISGAMGGTPLYIGVCMYHQCSATYLNENKDVTLDAISTLLGTTISVDFEFHDEKEPNDLKKEQIIGFIFTLFIILILVGLTILGTLVEHTSFGNDASIPMDSIDLEASKGATKTKLARFLEVFSISKNARVIL